MRSTRSPKMKEDSAMAFIGALCLSLLLITGADGVVRADDSLTVKTDLRPGVLSAHGDWTASLDYDLGVAKELWSQPERTSFRTYLNGRLGTRGTVAVDPDLNTHALTTDGGLTTAINLYRPARVELGSRPGEYRTVEEGFNYGRTSLSILGGYEADQRFDNRNITAGVEVGYALAENQGLKSLVPSLFVGYDLVFVDRSELNRRLGVDDDSAGRLRVFGSWKVPVGQWLPAPLDALDAHLDLRYYLSNSVEKEVRRADKDDAVYVAGALSYSFRDAPLFGFVNAVFLRIADGRIPPVTDDATTVTIGLALWER